MGIDPHISLLVAALDLKEVQLVRDAIRTADLSAGGRGLPASGLGPAPNPDVTFEPRRHVHPEPVYEPRRHIRPEPRYEPRAVIHPEPRIEQQLNDQWACCPPPAEVKPVETPTPSPIQPPWKVLPWQTPSPPRPVVRPLKVIIRRPDIVSKGGLLDVFI